MFDRLETLRQHFEEIEETLARPEVATDHGRVQTLAKERASIESLVSLYEEYRDVAQQAEDTRTVLLETSEEDIKEMAQEELEALQERREHLEYRLRLALLPKDPNDERDVIVEVRAGTGGEEAALFAAELYRMYARYAQDKGWDVDVIDFESNGNRRVQGDCVRGEGQERFQSSQVREGSPPCSESPSTEAGGRIHTSAATVAVLPEAEEVELDVDPGDLRIDIFHSSGHGGQNVQKVATAVRITHTPTGIAAVCQDERSQLKNRQRAMAVLRARLLDREMNRQQEEEAASRRSQVGSGDRSEKMRTYNFPQNRVTDHRIGVTSHNLDRILQGDLDEFIDAVASQEQAKLLEGDFR